MNYNMYSPSTGKKIAREIKTWQNTNYPNDSITEVLYYDGSIEWKNSYGQPLMSIPDLSHYYVALVQTNNNHTFGGGASGPSIIGGTGGSGGYAGGMSINPNGASSRTTSSAHTHRWEHHKATRQKACIDCPVIEEDDTHDIPTCDCKLCTEDRKVFAELGIEGYDGRPFPTASTKQTTDEEIHPLLDEDGNRIIVEKYEAPF